MPIYLIMRTLSLITVVALVLCTVSAADVPGVCTMDDLQQLKPTSIGNGWTVRYALAESGAEAGPWLLLYCLAEYAGADEHPSLILNVNHEREIVGSLSYSFLPVGTDRVVKQQQHLSLQMRPLETKRALFCAALPVTAAGKYRLEIAYPLGTPLASKDIVINNPKPSYWQQFANTRHDIDKTYFVVEARPNAARPIFTGVRNVLPDRFVPQNVNPADNEVALPGAIPLRGGWEIPYLANPKIPNSYPLKLVLDGLTLTVSSDTGKMTDWPDYYLLARWWVNGKPVAPHVPENIKMDMFGRAVSATPKLTITLGLPETLGMLNVGDKVRLQLLYCPEGTELLATQHLSQQVHIGVRDIDRTISVPLLTNPIEFLVTQMMLNARTTSTTSP